MPVPEHSTSKSSKKKLAIVLLLTILPWPAVWYGMYELSSIIATFVLYHGLCLLPAIVWRRQLWLPHLVPPTLRQGILLVVGSGLFLLATMVVYLAAGRLVVDKTEMLSVLTQRGFQATWVWPMSFYLIVINATLEELFWRGVILNELEVVDAKLRFAGTAWTAVTFAAWHYLVFQQLLRPGLAEIAVIALVGLGVFLSWMYKRTGSILIPIVFHALALDLAVMGVFIAIVLAA